MLSKVSPLAAPRQVSPMRISKDLISFFPLRMCDRQCALPAVTHKVLVGDVDISWGDGSAGLAPSSPAMEASPSIGFGIFAQHT